MPTPFDEKGEVDERIFREIIDFELRAGVDGLMVAGSYGQGPVMRPDQRMRVAEIAMEQVKGKVNKRYSGIDITPEYALRLVEEISNIRGIKLAWGTLEESSRYVTTLKGRDFGVFPGSPMDMVSGAEIGVRGTIAPMASVFPELCVELWSAASKKETEKAAPLQERVKKLYSVVADLSKRVGRTAYKELYRARGILMKTYPRWPAKQLDDRERAELSSRLAEAGWPPAG
jgi:dihydrodipicolinate synthase/N-acetylneuraminate lyase